MEITITPDGDKWLVTMQGQPDRKFGSKAAAWTFVMGIRSAEIITVKVYANDGSKSADVMLNSAALRN